MAQVWHTVGTQQILGDSVRNTAAIMACVPSKGESETRAWMLLLYLGGNSKEQAGGTRGVSAAGKSV